MNTNNHKSVYCAEGILQAVVVKNFLEQAGLSADLVPASRGNYVDVQVHASQIVEARSLLDQEPCYVEILYPAASM